MAEGRELQLRQGNQVARTNVGQISAVVANVSSAAQPNRHGFTVFSEGHNPVVDIVAIHGLDGHYRRSWTAANGASWLEDFLPSDIPNARILTYGYNACSANRNPVSQQTIYDHALTLIKDLVKKRRLTNTINRPIIFIAHSLGGVMLKSALIHCHGVSADHLPNHQSIKLSTHGILYIGTPQQGISGAKTAALLIKMGLSWNLWSTNTSYHENLERDSPWLHQQCSQYLPISAQFETHCFYETRETSVYGTRRTIVPQVSACLPGATNIETHPIHKDHLGMIKFARADDPDYENIRDTIMLLVQDAPGNIQRRWTIALGIQKVERIGCFPQDDAIDQINQRLVPIEEIHENQAKLLERTVVLDHVLLQQGKLIDLVMPLASLPETSQQALEGMNALQTLLASGKIPNYQDAAATNTTSDGASLPSALAETGAGARQIGFRFSRYKQIACDPWCNCDCHHKTRRSSPGFLHWLVGQVFCAYSGLPLQNMVCNENACRQKSGFSAHLTYYFPPWFLSRMLLLTISKTSLGEPVAGLYLRNTLPEETPLLNYIETGNLNGIKNLFDKHRAAPNDIYKSLNWDGLSYAIRCGQIDIVEFFLNAGADPYIEDECGYSVMDYAWSTILGQTAAPSVLKYLRESFVDLEDDSLDKRKLPLLHRIVLQLEPRKELESELQRSIEEIDILDSENKTALSWAVRRADAVSTELLLRYGARMDVLDNGGHAPIHYAALASSPDCMDLLIKWKCNPNLSNLTRENPLHFACSYQNDARYIKPLLMAGAFVDEFSGVGRTPLLYATRQDHAIAAGFLLENYADINLSDWKGMTPLHVAVGKSSVKVLRLLLECRANYKLKDYSGCNIAHVAALSANKEVVKLLKETDLTGLDVLSVNNDGYTAMDLLNRRKEIHPEFIRIFKDWLTSFEQVVDVSTPSLSSLKEEILVDELSDENDDGDDDSDLCFKDALEYQPKP